jgi:RHS repeat-associated protein
VYEFDSEGRHLRTRSALTGAELLSFGYTLYGNRRRLSSITDANGRVTTIERDASGHPIGIEAPNGQRTALDTTTDGYLRLITNPAAESITYTYYTDPGKEGLMDTLTDARNNVYTFTYGPRGRLVTVDGPDGGRHTLSGSGDYVERETRVSSQPAGSRTTTYEHASLSDGRTERTVTQPDGTYATVVRAPDGARKTTLADGTVMTTRVEGEPRWGLQVPLASQLFVQRATQATANPDLDPSFPSDYLEIATSRTYGSLDPLQPYSYGTLTETVTINPELNQTDPKIFERRFVQDTPSIGLGQWTTTSPEQRQRITVVDAQQRVVRQEISGLHPIWIVYGGANGDRVSEVHLGPTDPTIDPAAAAADNRVWSFSYDGLDRPQALVNPQGEIVTVSQYDDANRPLSVTLPGAGSRTVALGYDASGHLTSVTPPGAPHPHTFEYNSTDHLARYTPPQPDSNPGTRYGATLMQYNLAREFEALRLQPQEVDASGTPQPQPTQEVTLVEIGYTEPGGRLASRKLVDDGYEATFAYDEGSGATGQLQSSKSWAGDAGTGSLLVEQGYDWDGLWLEQETWSFPSASTPFGVTVTLAPNAELQLEERTIVATGGGIGGVGGGGAPESSVVWDYDNDGLLIGAGPLIIQRDGLGPDPADPADDRLHGLVSGTTLDQITTEQSFNDYGVPASFTATYASSTSLYEVTYVERDAVGRLLEKRESVEGGAELTTEYDYDAAGRLWRVWQYPTTDGTAPAPIEEYTYDENGNRLTAPNLASPPATGSPPTYDNQDRLLAYGPNTYTWTLDGRLATKTEDLGGGVVEETVYDYDTYGNLREVTLPTGHRIRYIIDALDRRVGRIHLDDQNQVIDERYWIYKDRLNPVAELDATGAVVARYVYGTRPHVPDYMLFDEDGAGPATPSTYRLITDHLGSVRLVLNAQTGAVAQRLRYDAYGRLLQDDTLIPDFAQPFGFAGGLHDRATGLVRFGARDYDPQTGRWTTRDFYGFSGGDLNQYQYCRNDPINFLDAEGLFAAGIGLGLTFVGPQVGGSVGVELTVTTDPLDITANVSYPAEGISSTGFLAGPGIWCFACHGNGRYDEGTTDSLTLSYAWINLGASINKNYICGKVGAGKGPAGFAVETQESKQIGSVKELIGKIMRHYQPRVGPYPIPPVGSSSVRAMIWATLGI